MKNVLLFLLCMVFIFSLVEGKIIITANKDTCYEIPKTAIAPVIDGIQDACWYAVDWNFQRYYNVGDPPNAPADSGQGLTGMSKAMWDANNIYWLVYSVDDVIIDIPANAGWNQDAVELYFDGTNDHTGESSLQSGVQYQFTIPHWLMGQEVGHLGTAFGTVIDTTGIEFKIRDVADNEGFPGWMTEVKIPLAALGVDGTSADDKVVGWELQQDESDDATVGRAYMSKWWSNSNNSWANAAIWGKAILSSRTITDSVFEISKLPTGVTPTIDGVMDPIYRNGHSITTNLFRVGDPPAAETTDTDPMFGGFITETPVYDETNFYIFLDVVDGIITDIPANAGWNQDANELYFDGTNDHSDEASLKAGVQWQFTIPHWFIGTEAGRLAAATSASFDTTGVAFKIVDHDARANDGVLTEEGAGYNIEVKLPLAALGIDGTTNQAIGWELQLDNSMDATVGRGGMEKWWNASNNSWANAGIWGYAKLGPVMPTVSVNGPSSVARGYRLEQNYPNPFNPSTKITFELAKSEKVKLAVYNLLGEQVAVLVNGMMSGTSHTVTFDAKNLASGIYFYKLEAGSTTFAKKMVLLK